MIQMMPSGERPHETARDPCEEAVKLARELGDQSLEAEALVWLSFIPKGRPMRYSRSLEQGEPGLAHAEAALEIARRINDPRLVGHALYALAQVQPSGGEAEREIYLEALVNLRQAARNPRPGDAALVGARRGPRLLQPARRETPPMRS
jgi:hypothetical protein